METLTPLPEKTESAPIQQRTDVPQELMDAGITVKNLEFLNHLELKEEMFNPRVMEKMSFLGEHIPDLATLQDIDMRLGHDGSMPRIDKIYAYLKLEQQAGRLRQQQEVIQNQIDSL